MYITNSMFLKTMQMENLPRSGTTTAAHLFFNFNYYNKSQH